MRLTFIFILFTCLVLGQEKPMVFYNESGEKLNRQKFIETKDYRKNLDIYFENDTTQIGLLVTRQKFGQLDKNIFENLKSYLKELTNKPIDSTQNIVINYLTAYPNIDENSNLKSGWNVLHRDYLKNSTKLQILVNSGYTLLNVITLNTTTRKE